MKWKKVCLLAEAALCCALAAMLAAAAIGIYREGVAQRQAGEALAWIYTKERIAARLTPVAPVFFVTVAMTAVCLILGVRDEKADLPANVFYQKPKAAGERRTGLVRALLLIAAAAMIAAGALNGSMRDVLVKAVNLCTECVGLG